MPASARKAKSRARKRESLAPKTPQRDPGDHAPRILLIPQRTGGVRVTEDTALTLGALWACVKVITEDIAGLPCGVFERRADGGNNSAPDDPADWLLSTQANPETPAFQWRETILAHALLWGNGYAEIERTTTGRPAWLWQLTPDRVKPERTTRGKLVYDVANNSSPNTVLDPEDMFHLRGLGFDGVVGYSVVQIGARSIGLGIALDESACSTLANDATPGGFIKHPGTLTDTARKNLQESMQKKHGGPSNRRTLAVFEEGMSWEQTGLAPDDLQLIEQRQLTPADMCRLTRVKPHKIADLARATFSNIEEENTSHVGDTLLPWVRRIEQEANIKLFSQVTRGRRYVKLNLAGLLRGNVAARTVFYTTMLDRGVFSINDVLALEDRNPIGPNGDKRFVPLNMQLLEKAGEDPPEPEPKPEVDQVEEEDAEEEDQVEEGDELRPAVMLVIQDACQRAAARATHRIADAAKRLARDEFQAWLSGDFAADHRAYLLGALLPPCLMLSVIQGFAGATTQTVLSLFAEERTQRIIDEARSAGAIDLRQASAQDAEDLYQQLNAAFAVAKVNHAKGNARPA